MLQFGLRAVRESGQRVLNHLVAGLDEPGASHKLDNASGAFMAVCIERIEETAHGPIFSIAHYFEQNGDLVPDPDVTLLRTSDGRFFALTYQDALTFNRAVELGDNNSVRANRRRQADLTRFVGMWMHHIQEQQGLTLKAVTL